MNRFTSLIIAGSIASIATLTIAQTTDATTCVLYRNCYYHASQTYKPQIKNDVNKNLYKSGILSIFIILVTTRIATTALETWLTKV
jgi:F420-0:gamma-glutamyl ligase